MKLTTTSFAEGTAIPSDFAFCLPDPDSHAVFGPNRNPHLSWTDAPAETRSFALICHDPDVPTKPDDVNQEGREVPADLPRMDFFHWLVANIPAGLTSIPEGSFADGVVARGRQAAAGPHGTVQGLNDYTSWFDGDPDMDGLYFGYDGPCPPWNDSIIHHYVFTIFALDIETLDLAENYRGGDLRHAIDGHIVDHASVIATYTLNPRLRG